MTTSLQLSADQYQALWEHLLQGEQEQVAFLFAEVIGAEHHLLFRIIDFYLVSPDELEVQESYHVSLTDGAQAKLIKMAWDMRLALVELHSHLDPHFPTQFSYSDLYGLAEFVPHVRWRLKGQPYAAIVVGPNDFDALVWRGDSAECLDLLEVGEQGLRPTGLTIDRLSAEREASDG